MMSSEAEGAETEHVCANCGIAEVDEIKLEECGCGGCDLVKYCSDKCRGEHREQHDEECKKRDNELFRQPDGSHEGECPICFLPMPLNKEESTFYSCCSTYICDGCRYANYTRNGNDSCPFCREPALEDMEESN